MSRNSDPYFWKKIKCQNQKKNFSGKLDASNTAISDSIASRKKCPMNRSDRHPVIKYTLEFEYNIPQCTAPLELAQSSILVL